MAVDVHPDLYHADLVNGTITPPSLSKSILHLLLTASPEHAQHAHPRLNPRQTRDDDPKFDVGTVAHSMLLEDDESKVEIIDQPNYTTKLAREARDWARDYGRIPLLRHQWDEVREMVDTVRRRIDERPDTPKLLADGKPEQTITWVEDGIHCRARIDWLHTGNLVIDDLKTTKASANPEAWTARTLYSIGADLQVAFYLRGCRAVYGTEPRFRFVVVESFPPYALSVIQLGPDVLELANRKIDHGLAIWKECLRTGVWPSYPTDTCWAELPAWQESAWLAREMREAA